MYLSSITRLSQADNLGGIIDIQVARKADITAIPLPVDGVIYGDITFAPGKAFYTWQASLDGAGTNNDSKKTREGSTLNNRLRFSVPKYRATISVMFEAASKDELIVLFKDGNGKQKIFGLLDAPVQFRYGHSTGTSQAAKNSYDCEFYYDGPENIFEYNGAISVAPAGPAPAIVKFGSTPETAVAIGSLAPGETLTIISDYSFDYFTTQ